MSNSCCRRGCLRNRQRLAVADTLTNRNANIGTSACARRFANSTAETTTVVTNKLECCTAPEVTADEFYCGADDSILLLSCCDAIRGYNEYDARSRCPYWPNFAHPRWLSCRELYDRRITGNA